MAGMIYVGLAVSAHNTTGWLNTSAFSNVSVGPSTGVLTILLPDGQTTKSGTVTSSTEIRCDGEHGDMHAADNGDSGSGDSGSGESSGEGDNGDADEQQQSCSAANLVPGAVVDEAELDDSGQTFRKVKLVPSA